MSEGLKGIITFFINYNPDIAEVPWKEQVSMFKELNAEFIKTIEQDSAYRVAIIPTTKEACRIEKCDFDQPFPRFVPNHTDIKENEKNKALVQQVMKKRFKNSDRDEE